MTWHVIDTHSIKHGGSPEWWDCGFRFGVSELKEPVSVVQVQFVDSKEDARRLAKAMNGKKHVRQP